jgi:hypothetical protein
MKRGFNDFLSNFNEDDAISQITSYQRRNEVTGFKRKSDSFLLGTSPWKYQRKSDSLLGALVKRPRTTTLVPWYFLNVSRLFRVVRLRFTRMFREI